MKLFGRQDALFVGERSLAALLAYQKGKMEQRVEDVPADTLLVTPIEDLVDAIYDEVYLEPIKVHRDKVQTFEPREHTYYPQDRESEIFRGFGYEVLVQFSGALGLFRHPPDNRDMDPPRAIVNDDGISIRIVGEDAGPDDINRLVEEVLAGIEKYARYQAIQLDPFNNAIRDAARRLLEERKARILKAKHTVAALGYPMLLIKGAPQTYVTPVVRKKLPIAIPITEGFEGFEPEPTMHDADYQNVLKIIENMTKVMERTPSVFIKMPEETLRGHYLVQLNGQYEGGATGETFNAAGKTDIIVMDKCRCIFVAECKIWHGPQSTTEALDQLLSYLTWRDTKAALMMFNHNKGFTEMRAKLLDTVKAHPQCKRGPAEVTEIRAQYVFTRADDPLREIHLAVMAFDIPKP